MSWHDALFYIVFLSQIVLISYIMPKKILGRMRHVVRTYPPDEYPKLYPKPIERYRAAHRAYRMANQAIVLLGIGILLAIIFVVDHSTFADDGFISEAWPAGYGMIQFLPNLFLEFSEFNHLKKMRQANSDSTRRAELAPRRLFDIVSPTLVAVTIAAIAGTIYYDLYLHDFAVTLSHDTAQRSIVLVVTNALLFGVASWQWFGRRLDPHQSSGDRTRRAAASIRSMLYVSIAMSIYFVITAADNVYDMDYLDAILMSLYFQIIVVLSIGHILRSVRVEDTDFDVYRSSTT